LRRERQSDRLRSLLRHDALLRRLWRGDRLGRRRRGGRSEKLFGHAVVVHDPAAPHLDPHVIAAARGNDREMLTGELRRRRQLVLDRAELVERILKLDRQELSDDAVDSLQCEAAACELNLARRRHHVRLVASVDHHCVAIDLDDGLEERENEAHLFTRLHTSARSHTNSTQQVVSAK